MDSGSDGTDVVVLWVDGSDPQFRQEKQRYTGATEVFGEANRHRDWGILQYLFRGLETNLPWVRRVHLVTSFHQCPAWLDTDHPKLNLVDVEDFMPPEVLPTFNSNAIQLCLHEIEGLAEQFILWDDDMFAVAPLAATDFFRAGLPCTQIGFARLAPESYDDPYPHFIINDTGVINQNFDFRRQFRLHWRTWLSPRNGLEVVIRNLGFLGPMERFYWAYYPHMPQAYLKQAYRDVWAAEPELMAEAITHRLRCKDDLTHKLIRYWQIASGRVVPANVRRHGALFGRFPEQLGALRKAVRTKQLVCINDSHIAEGQFERCQAEIQAILQARLPRPSRFER